MDQPSSTDSNALTLRIRFKSASLEEFINRYGVDVSPGGIFIRTKQPVDVGTSLQFEFSLADGSSLLAGLGTVAWVRENDPARANNQPGMGLRFDKLTPESQQAHQSILAEKARKEGKPQATPYPPTAFVAPASRPASEPEPITVSAPSPIQPEAQAPSPANFSKTLPAPASLVARAVEQSVSDADEFESGGKTEISDKPMDYYLKEAEAAARAAARPAEDFSPKSPLDDWKTDAHPLEDLGAPPAPEEVSISDSQAYATEAPMPPLSAADSGERGLSDKRAFASILDMGDTAEALDVSQPSSGESGTDSSSGIPVAVASSEKTEEVSLLPGRTSDDVMEPIDLGGGTAGEETEVVPPLSDAERGVPPKKRSSGLLIGAVVFAGAAAFAAVYLIQTRPWEAFSRSVEQTVVVKKRPAVAVLPAPVPSDEPKPVAVAKPAPAAVLAEAPAGDHAKPAAEEEATAKKAAPKEEGKPPAAEKPAEKKPAVEAVAEKATPDKAKDEKAEKPAVANAEPDHKPAPKAGSKAAAKAAVEPAAVEQPAGAADEEVYRLSVRSTPTGAEVLIDGEYFMRTPCVKRILDPKKSLAVTLRHEGYEPHERMIGSSDNWVKKGNERVLTVTVNLKKISKPTGAEGAAAPGGAEAKPATKAAPDFAEPDKL